MGEFRKGLVLLSAVILALAGCTTNGSGGGNRHAGSPSPTQQQDGNEPAASGIFARLPDVVQQTEPSVVTIATGSGVGSGVVYRSGGVIVTNAHVVGTTRELTVVLADGTRIPGRVAAQLRRRLGERQRAGGGRERGLHPAQ